MLGVLISSTVMSQDLNPLFQKKRMSLNFFPKVGINSIGYQLGATVGVGYNLFNRTEIGVNMTYVRSKSEQLYHNYFNSNLYAKYYLFKGKFSAFVEFDNNLSNMYQYSKFLYKPAAGFGIGYYAIKNRLAIEFGLFHTFNNPQQPSFFAPKLSLKWYFR